MAAWVESTFYYLWSGRNGDAPRSIATAKKGGAEDWLRLEDLEALATRSTRSNPTRAFPE